MTEGPWFALVESNTSGSGRFFCTAARVRGLNPVVLTADPSRYAYLTEDGIPHVLVDTSSDIAVSAACEELARGGLVGVTSSSEYYIATAASIAAKFGLPGPDAEAVRACRDKGYQRRTLAAADIAVPQFATVTSVPQARYAARQFGFPVVVKPVAGSGSAGVRLCSAAPEVVTAALVLLSPAPSGKQPEILVEEYVTGPEYSVETFQGQVIGITRKHLGAEPYFVEIGHDFPAPIPDATRDALARAALGATGALGLDRGAVHTELRMGPRGPIVIEVNPRLAGGMIPFLVLLATGVDLVDCCVAISTGRTPLLRATHAGAAVIRFIVPEAAGVLASVRGVDAAAGLPGVRAIRIAVPEGVHLNYPVTSFRDRLGYVITAAADVPTAVGHANAALEKVSLAMA